MTRKRDELNPLHGAASNGSDQASGIQGEEYLCGAGVPIDHRQITKSPRLAASSNESSTQDILGQDLRPPAGDSGTDDLVSLKAAAAGGDGAAQKLLGEMYLVGRWVERDYQRADEWLGRAASNNVPGAGELLRRGGVFRLRRKKLMLKHLEMAAGLGSPGDLEFLHRAAGQDLSEAQQLLGEMHISGEVVPRNFRQAAIWLSRAAKHKYSDAEALLRKHLHRAAQRNAPDDLDFLEGAEAEGVDEARDLLMYLKAKEPPEVDYRQAAVCLSRAAMCKCSSVSELLRHELRDAAERGDPHDLEFLHGAADEGIAEAQKLLGEAYLCGEMSDFRQAAMWLSRAAKHKCSDAEALLRKHLHRAAQRNAPGDLDFLEGAEAEGVDEAPYLLKYLKAKEPPEVDYRRAAVCLSRAAKCKGSGVSELLRQELRHAAERGDPRDLEFLHGAADQGCREAKKLLGANEPHRAKYRPKRGDPRIGTITATRDTAASTTNSLANPHDWNNPITKPLTKSGGGSSSNRKRRC